MDLFLPLLGKRNANIAHLDPPPDRRPPPPTPPPAYVLAVIEHTITERERPMNRHPVHFYHDGNLNFEVQDVHFRVHQSTAFASLSRDECLYL